jgi:hypothetical protein
LFITGQGDETQDNQSSFLRFLFQSNYGMRASGHVIMWLTTQLRGFCRTHAIHVPDTHSWWQNFSKRNSLYIHSSLVSLRKTIFRKNEAVTGRNVLDNFKEKKEISIC